MRASRQPPPSANAAKAACSAAGSLVSYAMGITNIDPIRFELLFERFLNPERISMPDIDIDFADRGGLAANYDAGLYEVAKYIILPGFHQPTATRWRALFDARGGAGVRG